MDYTNWGGDQPSMPITGEICVQMAAEGYGVWKNTDCFVKAGYICQAPRGKFPTVIIRVMKDIVKFCVEGVGQSVGNCKGVGLQINIELD